MLFAARILETYQDSGKPLDKLAMVASTVSSKMVEAMGNVEGFKFVECLTGELRPEEYELFILIQI